MRSTVLTGLLLVATACSGEPPPETSEIDDESFRQWALPERLREISGLALTSDERLLAVTDELAVVYELDYENGGIVKAFALGDPVVHGDFEGIAVLDEAIWLMTSDGDLYVAVEGENGDKVDYEQYGTGLGENCELEGMTGVDARSSLLLICKDARKKKKLRIYEWRPDTGEHRDFVLPEKAMGKAVDRKRINPSGIEVDPATGDYLVVAAGQHAVFRLSSDGELADAIMRLHRDDHRQAEGISMTRDGRLLIADEGNGGRARLAVYRLKSGE